MAPRVSGASRAKRLVIDIMLKEITDFFLSEESRVVYMVYRKV